jgi:general secretion pathway protein A
MYEKFYNFTKEPFHITPDPRFLYLSERHKQALSSIIYGIEKRKGFVAITGGVGVGKTIIIRAYLEKATNAGLKVIYLFHANVSFEDLVRTIYREFELEPATTDLIEMVDGLHLALIELYRQGKTVVIIIDEAQNMPIETLENLRMLSNLETPTEKLIQVVLVGQTELEELLEKHELRQLNQRIAIRARIAPLSAQESYAYIEHRLSVAGLDKPPIFSKGALDIIVKEANGVPRRLNVLCDNVLITGFGYQKNPVTASIAREVVTDFAAKQRQPPVWRWKVAALVGVAVFLAFVVILSLSPYRHGAAQMLDDAGLGQATMPEPALSPVSRPPGEPQLAVPVREVPPPSKPKGAVEPPGAAEPKAAIKPESAIQVKDIAQQKRGVAIASYKTRVVKRGETLSDLIREVYRISPKSTFEPSLIDLVKQRNPAIIDSNLILAGSVIRFPELPKEK